MSWENDYNLGTKESEGEMYSAGIAYIVIPTDVDRAKYIRECYKSSTVSIYSEHNGFVNRVPIGINALNFIIFPAKVEEFGSPVSFILDPIHKKPIITDVYRNVDEMSDLKEHQFKIRRELNGNIVEIAGSPDTKHLSLNVLANIGGEISLNVRSKDGSAAVNIDVDGSVDIKAATNTTIRQYNKLTVVTSDNSNDDNKSVFEQTPEKHTYFDDEHAVNTGKMNINNGEENFILGATFKKLFDNFIDEVSKITVTTAIGQMPILNKEQVAAFRDQTKTILSQVGYIDK
jgi:hypothetical protein